MADEHPAPEAASSPTSGPRRWPRSATVLAAVAVLAVIAAAVVAARSGRDGDAGGRAARAERVRCADGVDHLAVEAETGQRDDDLFDGFTSIGVQRSDGADVRWLNEPRQVMTQPSFSPSGDQVAVRWADGDYESAGPSSESIWVVDRVDGNARPLTVGIADRNPAWSPDGDEIAFVRPAADGRSAVIATVPAEGGPVRSLAELDLTPPWSTELRWTPAGALLTWTWDDAANETVVRRIEPDEEVEEIGKVDGRGWSGLVAADGEELVLNVWPDPASRSTERVAVDLGDGTVRPIDGPDGHLAASADGERLYLLDEGGAVHRAAYDGEAVTITGTVDVGVEHGRALVVGACFEGSPSRSSPDRPLLGTDWRLGFRRLAVLPGPTVDGCEEPACRAIRVALTEDYQRPEGQAEPCVVWTGTVRDEVVAIDDLAVGSDDRCQPYRQWSDHPLVALRVDGDLLRAEFAQPRSTERSTVTYGARYVGLDPAGVVAADLPSSAQLDDFAATTTTVAPPPVAACPEIETFASSLAAAAPSTNLASPDASTPIALAASSAVVVRGALVDGGLVSQVAPPADAAVGYELVVAEVLAGEHQDVVPGAVVTTLVPFRFDDGAPLPPALGALAGMGNGAPTGSIPVIAFLTDEGATWPGDLLVNGTSGLAVACPGGAPDGLVGTGSAWAASDLDALAALVRGG